MAAAPLASISCWPCYSTIWFAPLNPTALSNVYPHLVIPRFISLTDIPEFLLSLATLTRFAPRLRPSARRKTAMSRCAPDHPLAIIKQTSGQFARPIYFLDTHGAAHGQFLMSFLLSRLGSSSFTILIQVTHALHSTAMMASILIQVTLN